MPNGGEIVDCSSCDDNRMQECGAMIILLGQRPMCSSLSGFREREANIQSGVLYV